MKQFLLLSFCVFLAITSGNSQTTTNAKLAVKNAKIIASATVKKDRKTKFLRKKHAKFLANSPYKQSLSMTKSERNAADYNRH